MSTVQLEQRLTALEREVADLKAAIGTRRHPIQSLERIHGTFERDDAFDEAVRLGREWRKSQRTSVGRRQSRKK